MTVATYNIHGCVGIDRCYRPDRTAEVIRELAADIVALQEVDGRSRAGREPFQLERLAEATGFTAIAGPCIQEARGDYGNALLTNRPVLAVRRIDLSVIRREPRGALDVDLDIGGDVVRVVVTHLGLRHAERRLQVARLLEAIGAIGNGSGRRLVVLGDFNEWYPRSYALGILRAQLGQPIAPATFPAKRPILALDRIWVVPDDSLAALDVHGTPLARTASDHLPLRASLAWRRSSPVAV